MPISAPNLSRWYIVARRLAGRGQAAAPQVYYAGPGMDLHLVGHDDWMLIATTADDPQPWVVSTQLWAEHADDGDYGARNWPAIYQALARMSPEQWARLGWYRYASTDWPALTPSMFRELAARRAAAEHEAEIGLPESLAGALRPGGSDRGH